MDLFSPGSNPGGDLSWQSHPTDGSYSIYRWNNKSGAPPGDSHVRRKKWFPVWSGAADFHQAVQPRAPEAPD
jgi:hypothetical protein